jgi:hypothetical protein
MGEDSIMNDVAIVFIGTGRYLNFLPQYWQKIEENFLPNSSKTIFAFTDGQLDTPPENVVSFKQKHLSWPYITLLRFEIINKIQDALKTFDYLVFMDADTLVVDKVTEEEFFSDKPFFGVHHPCHYLKMPPHDKFPGAFETRTDSLAGVSEDDDTSVYFQGCLWGGKVPDVIGMIEELASRTKKDLENDVIAEWHDESHMNKFFAERRSKVHVLGPQFAYPEVFKSHCNFDPKIVHLAKDNSQYQQ